jgi:hypothetical protein
MKPDSIRSLDFTEGLVRVTPNEAASLAVRRSGLAPAGGATVELKSSETSRVTLNAPAGTGRVTHLFMEVLR